MSTAMSIEDIFNDARTMTGEARDGFLKGACGHDASLRARVDALLAADAEAGEFLATIDNPADPDAEGRAGIPGPHEAPGDVIGRYKILQLIGEGGFGAVYMAEQREPVKRKIALKIIKLGMDTRQVIARFEAERQALAMMDHPNIAKVLDAGATETGRPYFVMELVRGVPITEYCDTENLTTEQRLRLFVDVCNAVQHAHQKGIIHRDLKPSNVMITLHDGKPVPKVIDFGIAKATNRELTDKTLFTEYRQFVGTPEYMSPEQAEMSGLDIDTRSDIYSLGVLLYELLTGVTPFDASRLRRAGVNEMQRIIREEEPARPSTRLSSLSTGASTIDTQMGEDGDTHVSQKTSIQYIAKHRRTDPAQLSRQLKGDLDWIVLKAMEKDRARRYESATGLAHDIERHMRDEPVLASPPSATYRLRKIVRRNRGAVAAAAIVFLTLTLGVIGTSVGMVRSMQAEQRAEVELARTSEVKRLVTEMLSGVNPEVAMGADTTLLKTILDDTAARLEAGEIKDELIVAELHSVIGDTYWRIGRDNDAEVHLTKSVELMGDVLGLDHPQTLQTCNLALWPLFCRNDRQKAREFIADTLEREMRVFGPTDRLTLDTMALLASADVFGGRYDDAEPLLRDALAAQQSNFGDDDPDTLKSRSYLGLLHSRAGRSEEAERVLTETIERQTAILGPNHPDVLQSTGYLTEHFMETGEHGKAIPLLERELDGRRRIMGDAHWRTGIAYSKLSDSYAATGRIGEAESLHLDWLDQNERIVGPDDDGVRTAKSNLASLYMSTGDPVRAVGLLEDVVASCRRTLAPEDATALESLALLAEAYEAVQRNDEAESLLREALATTERAHGPGDWRTRLSLNMLAWHLLVREPESDRKPADALVLAHRACTSEGAEEDDGLWAYLDTLALAQRLTGDLASAVETQRRAVSLIPESESEAARDEMTTTLRRYEAAAAGASPN